MREFKIIDLRSEEVELPVTDDIVCFFIVNNINDESFINNLASKLLKPTSINYTFFGKHEKAWHWGFDEAHIERYPNSTWETVALTASWSDIEDFADELYSTDYAYTPETEVLLYYDDDEILKKVKELLPIMEQRNLASEEDIET